MIPVARAVVVPGPSLTPTDPDRVCWRRRSPKAWLDLRSRALEQDTAP